MSQAEPVTLYLGDCLDIMRQMPDNSIDALVTDPPAGIGFMGKAWDHDKGGRDAWVAWLSGVMSECLRVLKPGAHALVWALPRTSHWTGWALEEAGFEIRDRIAHLFGSGFPKSLDVSKAIDKMAGAEREPIGEYQYANRKGGKIVSTYCGDWADRTQLKDTAPATPAAVQWQGWGTALKPACEDWWLCRKPLGGTVAANVLEWGVGALNIDKCRIRPDQDYLDGLSNGDKKVYGQVYGWADCEKDIRRPPNTQGRFPANVTHDGSEEVLAGFPNPHGAGCQRDGGQAIQTNDGGLFGIGNHDGNGARFGDSGSAARFFYCPKASRQDREEGCEGLEEGASVERYGQRGKCVECGRWQEAGETTCICGGDYERNSNQHKNNAHNGHPTVKATPLMRWLCRLITPPGGTVLDPFMGSGSTGKACALEGFGFIGIELDPEYFEIAKRRIGAVQHQPQMVMEL